LTGKRFIGADNFRGLWGKVPRGGIVVFAGEPVSSPGLAAGFCG
jgi:hypothetical protein